MANQLKSLKTRLGRNKRLAEQLEKNPKEFARQELGSLMIPMGRDGEMRPAYEYVKNLTDNEANQFIRSVLDVTGILAINVVTPTIAVVNTIYVHAVGDGVNTEFSYRFVVPKAQLKEFKAALGNATSRTVSISRANALLKRISIKAPAAAEVRNGEALVRTVNYNYAGKDIKVVCTMKDNVFTVTSTEIK